MSLYRFYIITLGPLARHWFTPTVTGRQNIPKHGPAIIAANHLAVIDDALIPIACPRMVHFMGKAEYFEGKGVKGKLKKLFFTSAGVFPVDRRGGQAGDSLRAAQDILEQGKLFGIHIEGTRSPDGKLYKGHTGVARLAYATGAPIIPVGIIGSNIAQPVGVVYPHKHHCEVHFGEPIIVPQTPAQDVTHEMLRHLTDRVTEAISKLSHQEYRDMYAQDRKKQLKMEQSNKLLDDSSHSHSKKDEGGAFFPGDDSRTN